MLSTKPYLIRAIYDWCSDQGFTPYVQVIVDSRTRVPPGYVRDGQIVLNVGFEATNQLQIGNEELTFQARFNGQVFSVLVPIGNVAAIYARENGEGMGFDVGADASDTADIVDTSDDSVRESQSIPDKAARTDVTTNAPNKPLGQGKDIAASQRGHLTRIK